MSESEQPDDSKSRPSFLRVMFSVMAAFFGVQSEKNRVRDFQHSSILPYIVAGVLFTALFLMTLILIVRQVLA